MSEISGIENKSIVLIDPIECRRQDGFERIKVGTYFSGTSIGYRDPIGLEYIAAYLEERGYKCFVLVQGEMNDGELCERIVELSPFAVGFSVWTYNLQHVINLATLIKNRLEGVYVIVGGYHPTFKPHIVQDNNIDFAVLGEGERVIAELLDCLSKGFEYIQKGLKKIKGIAYKSSCSKIIIRQPENRLKFNKLPWPKRADEICRISKITGLTYFPPSQQQAPLQVSFSRGCPHRCRFCPSGALWRYRIRYRDPEDVVREIEYLHRKFGTNYVYFSDLSFNYSRTKTKQLCRAMIRSKIPESIKWSAMVKVDTDKKTLELMKEAGCSRLAYGVEAFKSLTSHNLKPWQNLDDIKECLQITHELGLITRCFLLIGFPDERQNNYKELSDYLQTLPIDNIRLAFVSPFPGTYLYEQYQNKITKEWHFYTGEYPILHNSYFSKEELLNIRSQIIRQFYNSPAYFEHVIKKIQKFRYLKRSFEEFFKTYLVKSGIIENKFYNRFLKG